MFQGMLPKLVAAQASIPQWKSLKKVCPPFLSNTAFSRSKA